MARLDRLAPVKEIYQIGAAIGREFSYELLRAVVGRDERFFELWARAARSGRAIVPPAVRHRKLSQLQACACAVTPRMRAYSRVAGRNCMVRLHERLRKKCAGDRVL